jgi:putative flavoprotein involved in K+ transport
MARMNTKEIIMGIDGAALHSLVPPAGRKAMSTHVNTIIVGGGQAGLSVSYYLTREGRDHLVLEQSDKPGEAWRNHRWDSFTLNTPNWQTRLPGAEYHGDDPDGFMSRSEVVAYLDDYVERFDLPVRYGVRVERVERNEASGLYLVHTSDGGRFSARNVVVATGLYQTPKVPRFGSALPPSIRQVHSDAYRNPQELLPGAVLVVGSAQSGAQIAEELYLAGKKVYLAVGRAGRVPRRYRGKDANWWSEKLGLYDRTVDQLPSPRAKFAGKPHISGTMGGHTLNLHQFARDGVTLLGHLQGVEDGKLRLAPDLRDNLAAADAHEADFIKSVDAYIAKTGMAVPEEELPLLRDGFRARLIAELDLAQSGITNVIWATSYAFDFSLVKLPVLDGDGFPIQTAGVTAFPGLYFVGLPWLPTAKSGLLYGVGDSARSIVKNITKRNDGLGDSRLRGAA